MNLPKKKNVKLNFGIERDFDYSTQTVDRVTDAFLGRLSLLPGGLV